MTHPGRDTASGRAYLDLRARARREGRPTDELLTFYVLERFLYRLSRSEHSERVILKGGMLMAAFGERRPTRDIDLLARETSGDVDAIASFVRDVLAIPVGDGVVFEPDALTARETRTQDRYSAVRIVVPARVNRAQHQLRVDVNVGDPVSPAAVQVDYPALLGGSFPLLGYPIETVLAEKLVTMVDRGDATTRDRDFADVCLVIRRDDIDAGPLWSAIRATADHRETRLRPLREALVTLGSARQVEWRRFVSRAGLLDVLPHDYEMAILRVAGFADPVLTRSVTSGRWRPESGSWESLQ